MIVYNIVHKYTKVCLVNENKPIRIKKTHSRNANLNFTFRRSYSTSSSSNLDIPIPVLTITDLQDKNIVFSKRDLPFFFYKKKLEVYIAF